jgi:hypothetical protein
MKVGIMVLVVILIILGVWYFTRGQPENFRQAEYIADPVIENFSTGMIYNHLLQNISVRTKSGRVIKITSNGNATASLNDLQEGSALDIFVDNQNFNTLIVRKSVSDLHIGMITTRWTAGDPGQDQQRTISTQGVPFIRIHNTTNSILCLNYNICVQPQSVLRYTGEHKAGVALGLYLKDQSGLYPEVQINKPVTDIYYGVSSPIKQPFYGNVSYTSDPDFWWDDQNAGNYGMYQLEDGFQPLWLV